MIDLTSEQLAVVKRILAEHVPHFEVWVFGSRVNAGAGANSDLDIAIISSTKIEWRLIEKIKDAFSSSDLPFLVDVLDYNSMEEGVARTVRDRHEIIQKK